MRHRINEYIVVVNETIRIGNRSAKSICYTISCEECKLHSGRCLFGNYFLNSIVLPTSKDITHKLKRNDYTKG